MDGSENELINFPTRNCEKQQGDVQVLTCVSVWCAPDITCVHAYTPVGRVHVAEHNITQI